MSTMYGGLNGPYGVYADTRSGLGGDTKTLGR